MGTICDLKEEIAIVFAEKHGLSLKPFFLEPRAIYQKRYQKFINYLWELKPLFDSCQQLLNDIIFVLTEVTEIEKKINSQVFKFSLPKTVKSKKIKRWRIYENNLKEYLRRSNLLLKLVRKTALNNIFDNAISNMPIESKIIIIQTNNNISPYMIPRLNDVTQSLLNDEPKEPFILNNFKDYADFILFTPRLINNKHPDVLKAFDNLNILDIEVKYS